MATAHLKLIFSGHILLDEELNKFQGNKMFSVWWKKETRTEFGTTICDIFWFWFLNILTIIDCAITCFFLASITYCFRHGNFSDTRFYHCFTCSRFQIHVLSSEPWYKNECLFERDGEIITATKQLTKLYGWSKTGWKRTGPCTQQNYVNSWVCLILMRHKWWICPESLASSR